MKNWLIILLSTLFSGSSLIAQSRSGSFETSNGMEYISAGNYKIVYAETLYLGPAADWKIDGEVHIYSRNVWVDQNAKITGAGTIYVHSPTTNPYYEKLKASATEIDANNGNFIGVNIVLTNPLGIKLTNIVAPSYGGGVSNQGALSAALKIGKSIDFRVDGASIYLNGNNLELSETGELLNYGPERMVVTGNVITGHMIRGYSTIKELFFPVGVEQGDYTPARLIPQTWNSRVHVSVNNYLASGIQIRDETLGMDRIWNVFADKNMKMNYTLSHNMQTNGVAYVDADARIVQNADGGNWIGDVTVIEEEGVNTRNDIETMSENTLTGTWFTKFSLEGPTANDDRVTMSYGYDVKIDVLANDEAGSSAIIRSQVKVVYYPHNGQVMVGIDGVVTYVPNNRFVGEDTFEYEIVDINGKRDSARVTVQIMPRELLIPNVLTPNEDGSHDRFIIQGTEAYDQIELTVINRWGNEVYHNEDYKDEWDGSGLNEGTYYPIIKARRDGKVRVFKTHVLLKRH
ncbi:MULTISPECIES: gliding motility-associated C-terminal domain-containing protein [Sphingobacterium]|uniref:T9SS type B sorting domain-containing protein n=1 Tax=Sphingobacterium TaxID=28453 RepID=UPI0013DD3F84|nr:MULTISPECIES: gliding motility-associated C-terminal domain-containing protein [unclassified Sphingobacterium]